MHLLLNLIQDDFEGITFDIPDTLKIGTCQCTNRSFLDGFLIGHSEGCVGYGKPYILTIEDATAAWNAYVQVQTSNLN